ncbi:MAG: hypothetical protein AB9915_00075 [Candidatus Dojkabacteria bacterium]
MTKNPFYNAFAALIYIVLIVLAMNLLSSTEINEGIASFVMPIMIVSLFTLSAAVMGYVFCYQPLRLFLEGKKEEAVKLFVKTVLTFGSVTLVFFLVFLASRLL